MDAVECELGNSSKSQATVWQTLRKALFARTHCFRKSTKTEQDGYLESLIDCSLLSKFTMVIVATKNFETRH